MSSVPPPAVASNKSVSTTGQQSPAQSQVSSSSAGDSYGQRRSGASGSFGAGASSRASSTPRNNQASKKQHKQSKRFRLADEDAFAESAAMQSINSRKGQTSITHLMNFALPPRPQYHSQHQRFNSYGRNTRRPPTWGLGSGYHASDKARYVHANYRFIVDPRADYHAQRADADVHLDWNNVLQILASSLSQAAACPICLGTPVAPRMARCGHIFCLPCLIRYMHSDDEASHLHERRARSKKCPICYDTIYVSETRPVRWYIGQEGEPPREGSDVVLRLVKRSSGSTIALPRDSADVLDNGEDVPWYLAADVMDYARVMRGSEEYMVEQFDEEIQELERQGQEDEVMFGEDSAEWTRKAVKLIRETKDKVKGIGNPPTAPTAPAEEKPKRAPIEYFEANGAVPNMYTIQHAAKSGQSLSEGSTTPATQEPSTVSTEQTAPPPEYYFYQALLHYYLSPLDIRILKAAFGSFSAFPSNILTRVERVSTGHIVDDDLRKRTKYLGHLPYGCEVGFLECDWEDTIAPEVLEKFKPEIERRRKKNEDKEAREEKARLKAEKDEDEKRWAAARRKRPSISTTRFTAEDFRPLVSAEVADSAASIDADSTSTSPPWPTRREGSSFASLASPSTSPSAPRTVWGTAIVPASSPIIQAQEPRPVPSDDGWLQGWEKDLLHEDDEMVAQAQALSLAGEGSKAGAASGGKKKKGKKITLMSTGVRRGA
ncbi:hypothetical protein W97_05704 [Coniosporium apollinis CBS 100218]|uniref:RING-type domain-containing protein n=1 Tax=Coniosporium apollinis (strain CBS 100218) TaxID=1168221 RepID=R7YXB9_CONA1|nr:uncharacterized protein W97_05704 [Coniosporium apollinis CBS 100218]EON66311.1 hypothetical protein W97_05704 [Coniosporium apollinis CBS 100218]